VGGTCRTYWTFIYTENLKRKENLENVEVNGKVILQFILKKPIGKFWVELILLRIGPFGGLL
jgi:hypothetical protein